MKRVHAPRGKLNVGDKQETVDLIEGDVECRDYDSITVSSVRIFGSVGSRGMSHAGFPLRMIAFETTPACTLLVK